MAEEKKKSKLPWIVVAIVIVVILAVVLILASQIPSAASKQYVEVRYSTVAWYYTYPESDNLALLVLNVQVTNINYSDSVYVYAFNSLSLGGFGLNMSGVVYSPHITTLIQNSSALLGWTSISPTLASVTLTKGGSTAGTMVFVVPKAQYQQSFNLQCAIETTSGTKCNVIITKV